jgi:predicted nucleic acid-binding protein
MRAGILDTSVLISYWHKRRSAKQAEPTPDDVRRWGRELIRLRRTDAIVTPVRLEFFAGAHSRDELDLFKAFLEPFQVVDDGQVTPEDWDRAFKYAERVPKDGKPRQLGDCLIRALAERLRRTVISLDQSFPKRT